MRIPILSDLIAGVAAYEQATAQMKGLGLSHRQRAEYIRAAAMLASAGMSPQRIRETAQMWAMYGGKVE